MRCLCSIRMSIMCLCCFICIGIANGQDATIDVGGVTIRGEVLEATPEQMPIEGVTVRIVNAADGREYIVLTDKDGNYEKTGLPEGRYTISVSKDGYRDRLGKPKVVAAGGEIFDRIKMIQIENKSSFFQSHPSVWLIGAGITFVIIIALVILFIDLRKPRY